MAKIEVEYLSHYGSCKVVVNSARVSFNRFEDDGVMTEGDKRLLDFCVREGHLSILEQVEARFRIKCPMYVARQIMRTRTFSYQERSLRYIKLNDTEVYVPTVFRQQSENKKQGSGGPMEDQVDMAEKFIHSVEQSFTDYENLLADGLCREQARGVLPTSTMVEFILKGDLRNLFHFLELRLAPDTQLETQEVANQMYEHLKVCFPFCCEAFEEHILGSKTFSRKEWDVIDNIINSLSRKEFDSYLQGMSERDVRIFKEKLRIE